MARLRSPVALSDAKTASSTSSSRPAKRPSAARIYSKASSPLASRIRPEQAIAPALTIGLNGWLSALSRIELKGSPDGSTPISLSTRAAPSVSSASANTKGFRHRLDGEGHPAVADLVDMAVERGEADAEMIGIGLAEFGDVVGDVAAGLAAESAWQAVEKPQQRRLQGGPVHGAQLHSMSCRLRVVSRRAKCSRVPTLRCIGAG